MRQPTKRPTKALLQTVALAAVGAPFLTLIVVVALFNVAPLIALALIAGIAVGYGVDDRLDRQQEAFAEIGERPDEY